MKYIIVFITASSQKEAEKIAHAIIDAEAAACVNIVPKIKSVFKWRGEKKTAEETLLIAKTLQAKFARLREKVKAVHSYEVPEIISIPISEGDEGYLNWIAEVVK